MPCTVLGNKDLDIHKIYICTVIITYNPVDEVINLETNNKYILARR